MKAVILAGGKGTRLGKLTKNTPKPLLQIANKSILEHQINLLKSCGVDQIIILVNHLSDQIINYLNNKQLGVDIQYYKETNPLGTAGGIKMISSQLKDDFLLLYGDIMINMDLKHLIKFHKNNQSKTTIVVHPNSHPYDSDLVEIDRNNKVIKFLPKPHPQDLIYNNLVNAALYVVSPDIFKYIKKNTFSDFIKDVFPKMLAHKENIIAYKTSEYLKDTGTPIRLKEVTNDILTGNFKKMSRQIKRPAIFLDRDGVINKYVKDLFKIKEFILIPKAAKGVKKINELKYLAIVITNQPAIAKGFCTNDELATMHKKMETLLGQSGAMLDGVYFCPHHPDKGFKGEVKKYKMTCSCRKPGISMISKAIKDFNIDLKKSYFIGDSSIDAMTAKNAGLKFIGVKTGLACKDKKYKIKIHFLFDNLLKAVNFIASKQ